MTEGIRDLPGAEDLRARAGEALRACGVDPGGVRGSGTSVSPITGAVLAPEGVPLAGAEQVEDAVRRSQDAFRDWRSVPAPARGALVGRLRELLVEHKSDLGALISLEVGKITSEAEGEVQEMIDICEFAVGLSRQLYGRTMPSERPGHRLMETWHPLGPVGIITAFNFPAAVWSWNAAVALVCGNSLLWKPSEVTPLTSLAVSSLLDRAMAEQQAPEGLSQLLVGDGSVGQALVSHPGVALLSATGSTPMGRQVGPEVARRFGRSLLELGGNNAAVVSRHADLDLALRGIVFAAAGTAGQRCTTLRRVIAHEDVVDELTERIAGAYRTLPIGNPLAEGTLVGPLINRRSFETMQTALSTLGDEGASLVVGGGRELEAVAPEAYYAHPALVRAPDQTETIRRETFAPVLSLLTYSDFDEAIALNNDVPHGFSAAVFTSDLREAERFCSAEGADCGIVNVNIGTSGAEIGGAFGGEKETGGGRESGSDAWKAYMRRATNTINYSTEIPLAQGVEFL